MRWAAKGKGRHAGWFYVKLTHARVPWEAGTSIQKMPPPDSPVGKSGDIFLTDD